MVDSLTSQILGPSANEATSFDSLETKYNFLCACREAFVNHAVPNSRLHQVNTVGDVKEFYLTPVVTKNPLEMTRDMDLPKNLHVMVEPHR